MNFKLLATALMAGLVSASDVHVLTGKSFPDFIAANPLALVEFYAPWCGHCKSLAPEYEKAATELASAKELGVLAKVDCTEEQALCQEFGVQGYPTLKVIRNGDTENPANYGGQRQAEEIVKFMKRQALPTVAALDKSSLPQFVANNEVAIVAVYSSDAEKKAFEKVAEQFRERATSGAVTDVKAVAQYGVDGSAVLVFHAGGEPSVYSGKFAEEELSKWLAVESVPQFVEIGPQNYGLFMRSGLPLLFLFHDNADDKAALRSHVEPLVSQLKGKANIAFLDAVKYGQHAENLNLKTQFPALAIHDIASNKKYIHEQDIEVTAESVQAYLESYIGGTLAANVKSAEPLTAAENSGPVFVLSGKEYDDVVLNDTKDVLVEFYAPWCGHCKNLAPIYEELGALYGTKSNVVVAKLDHTENEVPDQIQGYPTIKLFPAGKKDAPIEYQGPRTLEGLANFIKEKGTHQFDGLAEADADEKEEL